MTISRGLVKTCREISASAGWRGKRETYNLACSCGATGKNLIGQSDLAGILFGEVASDKVVHSELDSFFWRHTNELR